MTSIVLLDTSVLGLLCSSPNLLAVVACQAWLSSLDDSGWTIVIPEVTLYELRRELFRIKALVKLARLNKLLANQGSFSITPAAWLKAAEFWALVRSAGKPTSDPRALDGDAILAGVAATIGRERGIVTIATTNVGHLSRFPGVDARRWETIS